MNEKQAREKDYTYTGCYSHDKEELKTKKKERFTDKGYRAVIVTVPHNPLSRSNYGTGYTIYVEERYRTDEEIERLSNEYDRIPERLLEAQETHDAQIAEINQRKEEIRTRLNKLTQPNPKAQSSLL